jgi:hypothetical protein
VIAFNGQFKKRQSVVKLAYVLISTKKWVGLQFGRFFANSSGTDVMNFKIFSPKNLAKTLAFFAQTSVNFCTK